MQQVLCLYRRGLGFGVGVPHDPLRQALHSITSRPPIVSSLASGRQAAQHRVQRVLRELLEFVGEAVLDRVGHPHDLRLEAERGDLEGGRLAEGGGADQEAGEAAIVEGLDVVQTARYARPSVGAGGDVVQDRVGGGLGVGRLREARGGYPPGR